MTASATAERALCSARLYRPARNSYQRVFNRSYVAYREAGRRFYSQFVDRGDLVFDAGANRGLMSEMFLELGARVVAIEPHPDLATTIERRYRSRRLTVEQTAVGDRPGTATLHVGTDDVHSSISDEWIARVREHDELPDRWADTVAVPVNTLDDLIARRGEPAFIKIDVEGFEDKVLAGLSRAVRGLSFEYQCPALDMTTRCLARLDSLGAYDYQVAGGEQLAFTAPDWTTADGVMERLTALRDREPIAHGDVYARLQQP
jgi:FkbM family methyltransferase